MMAAREPGRGVSARRAGRAGAPSKPAPSAAEVGLAHHEFLELVSLEAVGSAAELEREAGRLAAGGTLEAETIPLIDFEGLAAFWNSETGRSIRAQAKYVRRELPFTCRFSPDELASLTGRTPEPGLADEFVVVQGVADLVMLLPGEIWLLDFKTDHLKPAAVPERAKLYEPQLRIYAAALSRIYARPVTKSWLYFLSCRELRPAGREQAATSQRQTPKPSGSG